MTGDETPARVVVIGVGNAFRRDDGAGLAIVDAARPLLPAGVEVIELDGEPARLVEAWDGATAAFVVDAVRDDAPAGTIHHFDASQATLPQWAAGGGTHSLGVAAAVDLARALDRLPGRLVVLGIEGADFGEGAGCSPAVAEAVHRAAARLAREVAGVIPSAAGAC